MTELPPPPPEVPAPGRRLLLLVPWLALGGADKFNLDILAQLRERGYQVLIATTLRGDHSWRPRFEQHTRDIFALHDLAPPAEHPRYVRDLIRARRVDAVLLSHSEWGYFLLPYLRAACPGVAFLDLSHIETPEWYDGGFPRLAVLQQRYLDRSLVISEHLRRWMVERGADPARVAVCYGYADPAQWRPRPEQRAATRRALGVEEDLPLILYIGRICPQKQPRVFARTMGLLRGGAPFRALVIGEGPDLPWLRSYVRAHGLAEQVRFLGALPSERLQELVPAADLVFLPSEWEGIALVLFEAMACGVPVVGARVAGQPELVTPDCGVLVPRGGDEAEAYARALRGLLADPARRREMGAAARARIVASFQLAHMGQRVHELVGQAMGQAHAAPRGAAPSEEELQSVLAQALARWAAHREAYESSWRVRVDRALDGYPRTKRLLKLWWYRLTSRAALS